MNNSNGFCVRSVAIKTLPDGPVPSPIPIIEDWLTSTGIVREGNEILVETTALAMGISSQELRAELQRRAFGAHNSYR